MNQNDRILIGKKQYVLTVHDMRMAERAAMVGSGEDELIERAAAAAMSLIADACRGKRTLVVCGAGNNGSDGLSLALGLLTCGCDVTVRLVGEKCGTENAKRRERAAAAGLIDGGRPDVIPDIIIDALFGIGLSRPVEGEYLDAVRFINNTGAFVYALDVPSGLNADTGEVLGEAVKADCTIAFSAVKQGCIVGEGLEYAGRIVTADIGIPVFSRTALTNCLSLAPRCRISHKGMYGRTYIVAGSAEMPGAAILAATGALYAGAGYTTLCVPDSMRAVYASRVTEAMLCFIADRDGRIEFDERALSGIVSKADAILLGNGLGANPALPAILRYLAEHFSGTLVLDADGLNALARDPSCVENRKAELVLTPHLGELYRLTENTGDVIADAERLAARLNCVVAAKSAFSVITDGRTTYLNVSGCAGMAKGGSGDALAGVITALAAKNRPLEAAALACYRMGVAGERVEAGCGAEGVTAGLMLEMLTFDRAGRS